MKECDKKHLKEIKEKKKQKEEKRKGLTYNEETLKAFEEVERMKENAVKYKVYKNPQELFDDMDRKK